MPMWQPWIDAVRSVYGFRSRRGGTEGGGGLLIKSSIKVKLSSQLQSQNNSTTRFQFQKIDFVRIR